MPAESGPAARRQAAAQVFVADVDHPELRPDDAHHLARALRLRPGEVVSVADGAGRWGLCTLGGRGLLEAAGAVRTEDRPTPALTVAFAPTKGDRPEWAVAKLTELGVDRIVALACDRGVVRWDAERAERHLRRWAEVARQSAMQCRRVFLPVVEGPFAVGQLVERELATVVLATPDGSPPTLERPTVLVGPEGGWSPAEEGGAPAVVGLGPFVLRTETAAVAAGALWAALRAQLVQPGVRR